MEKEIFVTKSSMPSLEEYVEEIKDVFNSGILTNNGPKHQKLAELIKDYLKADNVDLLVNGHMAIELSLLALELKGEVITTPFTFASTTHAIVRAGLTPVFCDVNKEDYTIDVNKIEGLITDKTCAILPVHVYGNVCDVLRIEKIAKKHNLKVIYDSAHAFGVKYMGKGISAYGDVNCFSFHATKVFNTIEGGAVSFSNKEFGEKLFKLRTFGFKDKETVDTVGLNAKMNEFCASMGICNLRHVEEEISKRKRAVIRYNERLKGVKGVIINKPQKDLVSNYAYYPIIVEPKEYGLNRDGLLDLLKEHNVMARKYFYPLTNAFDCYKGKFNPKDTPVALDLSEKVLTLPLFADLTEKDVDAICDIIVGKK